MRKETKGTLIAFGIAGIVLAGSIGIATALRNYEERDKFRVGDCVEQVYENEFNRTVYYHKILKVGKKRYMTNYKPAGSDGFMFVLGRAHTELKLTLNDYERVDNKFCKVKGE